jgi:4-amino-4-deoxy-L-arabinose transferase-like glycosyltransferase
MRRVVALALFLALLIPSAWFAWSNRDMPQFGRAHDDAIYFVAAKSLVDGHGYRIQSLPGAPFETKYPPLLVWLLALAWKIDPQFPRNLSVATAMQWAAIPLFLWLSLLWFRRVGLPPIERWAAIAWLAVSPYTVVMAAGIFTEVGFAAFLLASLIAFDEARLRDRGWPWAALAGLCAALAYLTRTAGVVALISGPVIFLLWKKRREAVAFAAAMAPAVIGWMAWVKLNHTTSTDLVSIYNTDYVAFEFMNVHLRDLGTVVWTNVGHLLYEMAALVFPQENGSFLWQLIRVTTAAAILTGLVRRRHDRALQPYLALAALTMIELIVWHYPPNLRLMYPLVPLFAVGALGEGKHFAALLRGTFRRPEPSQRVAGWLVGALAGALALSALWMQGSMTFGTVPEMRAENVRVRAENLAAYAWIKQNLPADATVLSINPALYLYTGRRTASLVIMPIYWYREDAPRTLAQFETLPSYAAQLGLDYVYMHWVDYQLLSPDHTAEAVRAVQANAQMRPLFQSGQGTLFQPAASLSRLTK